MLERAIHTNSKGMLPSGDHEHNLKSLGMDGFPIEIYKEYWDAIKENYMDLIREIEGGFLGMSLW